MPGSKRHTGPRANRFQQINRLSKALLIPHLVAIVFSTIAIEFSAFERVQDSESQYRSEGLRVKHSS